MWSTRVGIWLFVVVCVLLLTVKNGYKKGWSPSLSFITYFSLDVYWWVHTSHSLTCKCWNRSFNDTFTNKLWNRYAWNTHARTHAPFHLWRWSQTASSGACVYVLMAWKGGVWHFIVFFIFFVKACPSQWAWRMPLCACSYQRWRPGLL